MDLRAKMGNRIYGCDDCLAVCPWNKFAQAGQEVKLVAREDLDAPPLKELCRLDEGGFRALFSGSPVKRIGRNRFVRNVLIAIGNSGDASFLPDVQRLLGDDSALVRSMAVWALSRLAEAEQFRQSADAAIGAEADDEVRREWQMGLGQTGPAAQ